MLIYTEIFNPKLLHISAPIVDHSKSTYSQIIIILMLLFLYIFYFSS